MRGEFMTRFLSSSCYDELLSLSASSKRSIRLCAPYVKKEVIADILSFKPNQAGIDLITKVNLRDYHSKASDIMALQQTLQCDGRVYNCSNLHAKIYIFDSEYCMITSANLTTSGLTRNAECGVLTDDTELIHSAAEFYNTTIHREDVGRITAAHVTDIIGLLTRIPSAPRVEYPRLNLITQNREKSSLIADGLSGWKRAVFLELELFSETITTSDINIISERLRTQYPRNHNREAKIRQILQQLRDLGLIEFTAPGKYKKLWDE